jgi:hypothetical protein
MAKGDIGSIGQGGPVRLQFIDELDTRYAAMDTALAGVETAAAGFGGTESIDKRPLYRARDDYNADRGTFISLGGKASSEMPAIESLQTDEVNSYASTLNLFRKRLLHVTTWFYLLIAFGLDLALIALITELNIRYGQSRRAQAPTVELRFYTNPRFLWAGRTSDRS